MSEDHSDPQIVIGVISVFWVAVAFFGCWWYSVSEYGWFLGVSLGWIPSAIIALMIAGIAWIAFVYIPEEAPSLRFITYLVSIIFDIGMLCLFLYGFFFVFRIFVAG